jgi:hypothetical protein
LPIRLDVIVISAGYWSSGMVEEAGAAASSLPASFAQPLDHMGVVLRRIHGTRPKARATRGAKLPKLRKSSFADRALDIGKQP